jgi:hypothetical protein
VNLKADAKLVPGSCTSITWELRPRYTEQLIEISLTGSLVSEFGQWPSGSSVASPLPES